MSGVLVRQSRSSFQIRQESIFRRRSLGSQLLITPAALMRTIKSYFFSNSLVLTANSIVKSENGGSTNNINWVKVDYILVLVSVTFMNHYPA